ncbi:MAG: cell division protein FtsZ [Patescibacteria group bacterium]|nr:cell division protein FtsZ [Patescibacteria group bacterium]MDD5121746.1 cell division protein FtsZ [Patescibacteria group bacterium]MDD5396402.1 cell division protein FtsZ [Patescibacteria group bacterium]
MPSKAKKKKKVSGKKSTTKIKIVGVGGAGCAVIDRLVKAKIPKIEFIAINTDSQSLAKSLAHKKIRIGRKITKGFGTGMDPRIGAQAIEESGKKIKETLKDAEIIFFIAGLGGGTGSGALPAIADLIKDLNILTIALVTKPFTFEGSRRINIAEQSYNSLAQRVDSLISLSNENILSLIDRKTSLTDAFRAVDAILEDTIRSITEIINFSGLINLDLADLKTILSKAGRTLLGIGEAEGEGRAIRAVRSAIESPFFSLSFKAAKGIIFIVSGAENVSIYEINEAAKYIIGSVDSDCRVVFGVSANKAMGNKLKIIVIATGFNSGSIPKLETRASIRPQLEIERDETSISVNQPTTKKEIEFESKETFKDGHLIPEPADELEIPAFLRKKKII